MDNVLVDFPSAFSKIPKRYLITHKDNMDEVPGIFGFMDPIPGAIESFNELADLFDTYILSTAPWDNHTAWSDKLEWVKKHLGDKAYKRLILSHHKHLNAGEFLLAFFLLGFNCPIGVSISLESVVNLAMFFAISSSHA